MKKVLFALLLAPLFACSHAYISQWDKDQVTACCPTKKLFCKESALEDVAKDRCGGSVTPLAGGTRGNGNYSVNVNKTMFGNYGGVSEDTEKCALFKCEERAPANR